MAPTRNTNPICPSREAGLAGQGGQGRPEDGGVKSQADKKEIIAERAADGVVSGESA